ncbi:alpha/beta-hydrolase [Penicillium argentinense]|uniref:Alpha/beta-hydrolase n=1 Tax=Penicillium argentinense TaxID=1131581 RepID=A0A9W9FF10_9EURO|nr:alpha/beta-hydrolase [Penicillium argentinense]KAJ5098752.1 alpha/beta-hydrolase [Penicillium argentinense]
MVMLPASNPEKRIGNLMINPGGPIDLIISMKEFLKSTKLHEYFDILGPGPRGTAHSTPVQCEPAPWNLRPPQMPQTEAEFQEMTDVYHARAQSCVKEKGNDIVYYVDTMSVTKDLEEIRMALGNETMNYIGFSTQSSFSDNIRAIALDGIMEHSKGPESNGYEVTLNKFFEWCEQNNTCALQDEKHLPTKFDAFIDAANTSSIPAPSCADETFAAYPCLQNATGHEILRNMQSFISFPYPGSYGLGGWPALSEYLKDAMNGKSSYLSTTEYTSKTGYDISYSSIFCQDTIRSNWGATDYQLKATVGNVATPHTRGIGEVWYLQTICASWPTPVRNPQRLYVESFKGRNMTTPILMTNALYDPETPIQWALSVLKQFGENARLVIRDGPGHTSYYHEGETHDAIDDYLIQVKVPGTGTMLKD